MGPKRKKPKKPKRRNVRRTSGVPRIYECGYDDCPGTKQPHPMNQCPAPAKLDCPQCGAKVHITWEHLSIGEHGERWTCAADAPERKPPCVRALGCLCAGHARGNPADAPCDAVERPSHDLGDPLATCCCTACGGTNVQYAVWHNPNTGETFDLFGSWNAGDNTYCADCDSNGRNPNPPLVDSGGDPDEYLNARSKRLGDSRGGTFIPPTHDEDGARIDAHGNPTEDPDAD